MDSIKISIIVLTYIDFSNLENNLRSISEQSFKDYEVIIHDDGSENFDYDEIKSFASNIKNCSIYHNPVNVGTVQNYNEAIKKALGKYIVPLSQDDCFCDKDSLKVIYDYFESHSCHVLVALRRERQSWEVLPTMFERKILESDSSYVKWICCAYYNYISGSATYYEKSFLESFGLFDTEFKLLEDHPMVLKLLHYDIDVSFIPYITIEYDGINGVSSIKKKPSHLLVKDNIRMYEKYVLPNISIIKSIKVRRIIAWRALRWSGRHKQIKTILKYLDVCGWLLLTKLLSIIFRNKDLKELRLTSLLRAEGIFI